MEKSVKEFLEQDVGVGEIVQIREDGHNLAMAYADNKGQFIKGINERVLWKGVVDSTWEDVVFASENKMDKVRIRVINVRQ